MLRQFEIALESRGPKEEASVRITRWLRSRREPIPIEAECTACPDAQFKIKYDKRSQTSWGVVLSPYPPHVSPDRDDFMAVLLREFNENLTSEHPDDYKESRLLNGWDRSRMRLL
jgi:hypothetical protein